MSSSKDEGPSKGREPRSGPRKVSSLSADQLERKRANDREAQRSIRQRTKDHIEHLENQVAVLQAQVAQMRPHSGQFDELLRQNSALQHEVGRLKHQLATLTGRPGFAGFAGSGEHVAPYRSRWHMEEGPSNAPSSIPTTNAMLSSFPGPSHPPSLVRRAHSAMSASSRSSHPHDWPQPQYSTTRSPSLGETSEPEYAAQIKYAPYVIDGHATRLVQPSIPVAASQLNFGSAGGASQQPSETSFAQIYPRAEGLQSPSQSSLVQPTPHLLPGQRFAAGTASSASATSQPNPAQPYQQSAPPFQNILARPSQRDPNDPYPWVPQS